MSMSAPDRRDRWVKIALLLSSLLTIGLLTVAALNENIFVEWRTTRQQYAELLQRQATDVRTQKIADQFELKIVQNYLPELKAIDRCVTCHAGIDDPRMAKEAQPFRTHPGKYLINHPPDTFGCSVCHQGQGRATFSADAHGRVPFWTKPMYTKENMQAGCMKCHSQEPNLPDAPKLNEGRMLMVSLGCQKCHNVGFMLPWEAPRQIGTDLSEIKQKVNANWLVDWLQNPRRFQPATKMPDFRLPASEAKAIAAYLLQNSDAELDVPEAGPLSPQKVSEGKALFATRGCMGCHQTGKVGGSFAPNLSRVGEKIDRAYLADWISHPRKYQPNSSMPDLKLSADDAAKIAMYLSTLRNKKQASEKLALDDPKTAKAGRHLIERYSCASCHRIPGFDLTKPPAPDLASIGSLPLEHLDFGKHKVAILQASGLHDSDKDVLRAREIWLKNKLRTPHIFDKDMDKRVDQRARMPNFHLTEKQIDAITTVLLGLTGRQIPAEYRYTPAPMQVSITRGQTLFRTLGCSSCHGKEGVGGIKNRNYTKPTVPALNTLAEKLHLEEKEDTEIFMRLLVQDRELSTLVDNPPVDGYAVVLRQYNALRDILRGGRRVRGKDPKKPPPSLHMPAFRALSHTEVNDIIVYLLSRFPWEEEDEDEGDE